MSKFSCFKLAAVLIGIHVNFAEANEVQSTIVENSCAICPADSNAQPSSGFMTEAKSFSISSEPTPFKKENGLYPEFSKKGDFGLGKGNLQLAPACVEVCIIYTDGRRGRCYYRCAFGYSG